MKSNHQRTPEVLTLLTWTIPWILSPVLSPLVAGQMSSTPATSEYSEPPVIFTTLPGSISETNLLEAELNNLTNAFLNEPLRPPSSTPTSKQGGNKKGITDGLSNLVNRFSKAIDLGKVVKELETSILGSVSCQACRAAIGLISHYIQTGRTTKEISHTATKLCINMKLQTPRVCEGLINVFMDEIVEILPSVTLDSSDICAFVVGESCGIAKSPSLNWLVTFPPIEKPPVQKFLVPEMGSPKLKVLQISDTHLDPYYEVGSNAECGEPLCCRQSSGSIPTESHQEAGLWGDYRSCDCPRNLLESLFEHISITHKDIDYIIWTGDIPPHDIWNQTRRETIDVIRETVDLVMRYFPNTPIFPALGNHESVPVYSFPPPWVKNPRFTMDWLYTELQKEWSKWLPSTTDKTVKEGAYYSTVIKPGFKLISLNMNYCSNKNLWLLLNSTDPADELKWLIFELQSSELAQEKVHIIGHIPPGHTDCLSMWSTNYNKIISRFESTISAAFFGHTHNDELELFYSKDPYKAFSVAYIGPSVTPYSYLNPGYRIYYIDGDYPSSTRMVLDHETWITDLGEANMRRAEKLHWYKLYSAKEAYGMDNLSPENWDKLIMSMYKNRTLFDMYYKFYHKKSSIVSECNDECRNRILCDARSGISHSREELCKSRSTTTKSKTKRLGEKSKLLKIFTSIASILSPLIGYLSFPFGFG